MVLFNILLLLRSILERRQIFVDQSQSFSVHFKTNEKDEKIAYQELSNYLLHSFQSGNVTHLYYNRQKKTGVKKLTSTVIEKPKPIEESLVTEEEQPVKACPKRKKDDLNCEVCQ
jgi:hypothetical protein